MRSASRRRLTLTLLACGAATVALAAAVVVHAGDIFQAARTTPPGALIALVFMQVVAFAARAEAWGVNMRVAGAELRRSELHAASAVTFVATTVVPMYVGNLARVAVLRRLRPDSGPTAGQMVAGDGISFLIEGAITGVMVVVVVAFLPGLSWWWSVAVVAGAAVAVAGVWFVRHRFASHRFARAFDVFDRAAPLTELVGLLGLVLVLLPARYYIALHAVGIDASVAQTLLAFLTMNALAALPFGPSAAVVGAVTAVFGHASLAAAAAAGVVLAGTTAAGAIIYLLWLVPVARRLRAAKSDVARTRAP